MKRHRKWVVISFHQKLCSRSYYQIQRKNVAHKNLKNQRSKRDSNVNIEINLIFLFSYALQIYIKKFIFVYPGQNFLQRISLILK